MFQLLWEKSFKKILDIQENSFLKNLAPKLRLDVLNTQCKSHVFSIWQIYSQNGQVSVWTLLWVIKKENQTEIEGRVERTVMSTFSYTYDSFLQNSDFRLFKMSLSLFVYYETIKWEVNKRLICECRYDERLKSKVERSTRLTYRNTVLCGGQEHLR